MVHGLSTSVVPNFRFCVKTGQGFVVLSALSYPNIHVLPRIPALPTGIAGFRVTPFKIDQSKDQNCSIDKVQNLGNEGGTYIKTLAKIQVRGIFHIRDIRRNVLLKLIEICMETPCWCSLG